jgi:glycosyltransferase involved in cell wall biosynthesis
MAMTLLEAMSAGTPVLFPNLGAMPEVVGYGGWSYAASDNASLASSMGVVTDLAEVDRRGLAARDEYERRFSPDVGLGQLEAVYRRAMVSPRSRNVRQ